MSDYNISAEIELRDNFSNRVRRIGSSSREMERDMNTRLRNIEGAFSKVGNKIEGTFKKAFSVGFGALKKFTVAGGVLGGYGIKKASDFETLRAKLLTANKGDENGATKDFEWANKKADSTPFSNESVTDAVFNIKLAGFDYKKVFDVISDSAGANNRSLEDAVMMLIRAKQGDFERAEGFGVSKKELVAFTKELSKTKDEFKGTFSKNNEILKPDMAVKALLKLLDSKFKGGTENLSKTLKGQLSTTMGLADAGLSKIFGMESYGVREGSMLDKLKNKLTNLNEWLQSPEGKKGIDEFTGFFDRGLEKVIDIAGRIKNKFLELSDEGYFGELQKKIDSFNGESVMNFLDDVRFNVDYIWDKVERIMDAGFGHLLGKGVGAIVGGGIGFMVGGVSGAVNGAKLGSRALGYAGALTGYFKKDLDELDVIGDYKIRKFLDMEESDEVKENFIIGQQYSNGFGGFDPKNIKFNKEQPTQPAEIKNNITLQLNGVYNINNGMDVSELGKALALEIESRI